MTNKEKILNGMVLIMKMYLEGTRDEKQLCKMLRNLADGIEEDL